LFEVLFLQLTGAPKARPFLLSDRATCNIAITLTDFRLRFGVAVWCARNFDGVIPKPRVFTGGARDLARGGTGNFELYTIKVDGTGSSASPTATASTVSQCSVQMANS